MKKSNTIITRMDNITIVATFFFLWLAVFFEERVENIFAYILILSFGILHGANDLKLLQKSKGDSWSGRKFIKLISYYISFVLLSLTIFYFIPVVALLLFIAFSGYHFGEQHWVSKVQNPAPVLHAFYTFYGLFILFILFNAHEEAVSGIIEKITGYEVWQNAYFAASICCGVIAVLLFGIAYVRNALKSVVPFEVFVLFVFFIVFNTASLLWAFAIYFILWHSLPSLAEQILFLHGNLSKKSIKKYIMSSFPYWFVSVIGLGLLLFIFRNNFETSLSFFFSFLAAITFPHVLVISRLNNR